MADRDTEKYLKRCVAARMRVMAAEADMLLVYVRSMTTGGELLPYLEKLGKSLRGRADKVDQSEVYSKKSGGGTLIVTRWWAEQKGLV